METKILVFVRQKLKSTIKEIINGDVAYSFVHSIDELASGLKDNGVGVAVIDREYSGLSAEMVGTLKALYPDTVKIVLTERPDLSVVMDFINSGSVFGFVPIPFKPEIFSKLLSRALSVVMAKKQHNQLLEKVRRFDSDLGILLMQRLETLETENNALKQQVVIDPLTGGFNVRYMRYRLTMEYDKFLRYGETFSILMLDLDDFKAINDIHGHQVGDLALKKSTQVMKAAVRSTDVVIRYGGDEFMIIAPNTVREGAVRMGKRVEDGLREAVLAGRNGSVKLSMSIGSVTCEQGYKEGVDELVRRADEALYHAKHSGKKAVATWKDCQKGKQGNEK